ncbi:MAG: cytochrome c biogenesis protein CcsA [Chlamydiae bacterium]|nr:cytochrome c biogenesis protein CcsA [Chlamydiota bacterium]MBI3277398.1 cytochrome c biogenesis protein CcsA [Chlamydiota bacterium]
MRLRIWGGVILVIVLVVGILALILPSSFHKGIPSFNAFWFGTHVFLSLLGYAAFTISFISGFFYLVLERELKLKTSAPLLSRLPPLEYIELISFRSLWAGTLLLGLGLINGIFWAWWGKVSLKYNDPKVMFSFLTWLIYGVILYIRSATRWRGRKVAYLSMIGFALILINFFIMNYVSKGHGFF